MVAPLAASPLLILAFSSGGLLPGAFSPRVMHTILTFDPESTKFRISPPQPLSASSGWAPKTMTLDKLDHLNPDTFPKIYIVLAHVVYPWRMNLI
jgi:hypothetical protein